jgi:cystathionine beta-lyase/cystathionine gamma-synthase
MAATSTILELLDAGSHVVALDDLYGGTRRVFERVRRRSAGHDFTYSGLASKDELTKALKPQTKMIWVETPSNPLLKLVDLQMIAEVARQRGIITVADNTFASPWVQRPLEHGFDVVMHSATKYLNGHSDVISGVVATSRADVAEKLGFIQNAVGSVPSPFDCFLVTRGLKTLALRMQRHCENAARIAEWLSSHPRIESVFYPGLPSHPQHALAKRQMAAGGGMVSAIVKGGESAALRMLERCQIFTLAESLGGVESLIEHPAIMTHASVPADVRKQIGISDALIRLSVGVEDLDDLVADLDKPPIARRPRVGGGPITMKTLLALALGLLSLVASAQVTLPAGVTKVTSVEGITEYNLANGLRVLFAPDPSKPTTTVNTTYMVGSRHENYGETGMAHLLEHLLFKGTPTHPLAWLEFTKRGLRANGSTWTDRTNYFASFAANDDNLDWYLRWSADAMTNSFIARKDLDSEMTVVRNEMERGENNPVLAVLQRSMSAAFSWHNYGKSTIGARADVENVDIDRLQAFYRNYYQPDNAVLIIAGSSTRRRRWRSSRASSAGSRGPRAGSSPPTPSIPSSRASAA